MQPASSTACQPRTGSPTAHRNLKSNQLSIHAHYKPLFSLSQTILHFKSISFPGIRAIFFISLRRGLWDPRKVKGALCHSIGQIVPSIRIAALDYISRNRLLPNELISQGCLLLLILPTTQLSSRVSPLSRAVLDTTYSHGKQPRKELTETHGKNDPLGSKYRWWITR